MALKQVLEVYEVMDSGSVSGSDIVAMARDVGIAEAASVTVKGPKGSTDFVKLLIPGSKGKTAGGSAPTLGLIGRLGGLGARPERTGFVSDGDGALTVIAAALKLGLMAQRGDQLAGDVIVATHICPNAPTRPHHPVPFMDSPVEFHVTNDYELDERMDAVLSVDTTKGNRIINTRGFALSPTVKQGYILRVSEDLLDLMQITTGRLPAVFAVTTQDITPYGNGVFHLNSILQPSVATAAPTVGVAITTETAVPGCATGATHLTDIEMTARFCIETAKAFTQGQCRFYDEDEFTLLQQLYGPMTHLQAGGSRP
ncbi:MAG: DUF1177 domain-containing protein [Sporomusaceae bacterium]|nr:DUF1177 domain-containing protein [Sporomusaceae bacterium]